MLKFILSWQRVGKTSTLGTFIRNKQIALLYYFARAAIIKYHRLLNITVLEIGSLRSRC